MGNRLLIHIVRRNMGRRPSCSRATNAPARRPHPPQSYQYDRLVQPGPQTIRLRPAPHARTPILSYELKVEPQPHSSTGSRIRRATTSRGRVPPSGGHTFRRHVDLVADMVTSIRSTSFSNPTPKTWPFTYEPHPGQRTRSVPESRSRGSRAHRVAGHHPTRSQSTPSPC